MLIKVPIAILWFCDPSPNRFRTGGSRFRVSSLHPCSLSTSSPWEDTFILAPNPSTQSAVQYRIDYIGFATLPVGISPPEFPPNDYYYTCPTTELQFLCFCGCPLLDRPRGGPTLGTIVHYHRVPSLPVALAKMEQYDQSQLEGGPHQAVPSLREVVSEPSLNTLGTMAESTAFVVR